MNNPQNPVRRNSFRRIDSTTYLDITLGRVRNTSIEHRNGTDHIVTEFMSGTLIMSEQEMRVWVTSLITSGFLKLDSHQRSQVQAIDDEPDYELRHAQ
jgi:hypothetical protein